MRRKFDLLEVVAIVVFTVVVTASVWNYAFSLDPPIKWTIDPKLEQEFVHRFGREHYSTGLEEYIIRDFFKDRRDGVFLDVGAFHYQTSSNTYRLEHDFGWSGLAIDANAAWGADYARYRPRTRFVAAYVDDHDGGEGTIYFNEEMPFIASKDKAMVAEWKPANRSVTAPRRTLNSLLAEHRFTRVDFVNMDIELGEPSALRGFDISKYKPTLICIEAHYPVRQEILEYFARAGYVLLGKYQLADPANYYFTPLGSN